MRSDANPVVIVGAGGLFPSSPTLAALWSQIESGVDTAREPPPGRWVLDLERAYAPERGRIDRVYSRRGCYLEPFELGSEELDLRGGSLACLAALDPSVTLLLEAGRRAFVSARMAGVDRARVGVVVGNLALPTEATSALADRILGRSFERDLVRAYGLRSRPEIHRPVSPLNRWALSLPVAGLASALGLGGGHTVVDAACASSLYALRLAIAELEAGRADAMLAGGLSRPDSLYTQMGFSQLLALSPSGRCSPFDARADGLVVGEGAGVVVLKRLRDALAHGDRIWAVIRGVGLSNDIEGNLLAPSEEGQLRALRAAYARAGWRPSAVDLIECHATGTPLGDATEARSLSALWRSEDWRAGQCVLSSVKSNVGHLLTAAGAAGLIKTLLALERRVLPPTANFEEPPPGLDLTHGPFRVLRRAEPWEAPADRPRRAAVSGFGFGGINAHVLLEEWTGGAGTGTSSVALAAGSGTKESATSEIVGLGVHLGPWRSRERIRARLLGGGAEVAPAPKSNFWGLEAPPSGYFLERLEIPLGEFRIPPRELLEALPQQTLLLEVAKQALIDARMLAEDGRLAPSAAQRAGVFVGLGLDLESTGFFLRWALEGRAEDLGLLPGEELRAVLDALHPALDANRTVGALGSIVASRVAREFGIGGPSFALSGEETSGLLALEAAHRALGRREIDLALVGAVDLVGDARSLLAWDAFRPFTRDAALRPFDAGATGTLPGEGAVVLVLRRADEPAGPGGARAYARLRGIASTTGGALGDGPDSDTLARAFAAAYRDAGVERFTVDLLETHGSGHPAEDRVELEAMRRCFADASQVVITSAKADVGHTGAAAALASVAKAALALRHRVLPPLRGLDRRRRELAEASNLRPLAEPRYWLARQGAPRRAAVSALSTTGGCAHAVLEEAAGELDALRPLGASGEALFLLAGDAPLLVEECARLADLARGLAGDGGGAEALDGLARRWWHEREPGRAPRLALVASGLVELEELCVQAAARLDGEHPGELGRIRPGRIFFSPSPVRGELAFVFPGSGNHAAGMGREIAAAFPHLLARQEARWGSLISQIRPDLAWEESSKVAQSADPRSWLLAQTSVAMLLADLLRDLGVEPDAAIGYSLGETAALLALGAWPDRQELVDRVLASDLFTEQLAGPCLAARRHWGLAEAEAVDWSAGVVPRSAEAVRAALEAGLAAGEPGADRVYLLLVNAPDECVLGGQRRALERLAGRLGAELHPLAGIAAVHCPVAQAVEPAYRELHRLATVAPPGIRFYSGALGLAYEVESESAAAALAALAIRTVDFQALLHQAFSDGVRLFVEVGPGGSCSRMIERSLAGKPCFARSASPGGRGSVGSLLRLLGALAAEGWPVRLDLLYGAEAASPHEPPKLDTRKRLTVSVGRAGFGGLPPRERAAAAGRSRPATLVPEVVAVPVAEPVAARVAPSVAGSEAAASLAGAHQAFLALAERVGHAVEQQVGLQTLLVSALSGGAPRRFRQPAVVLEPPRSLGRAQCLEFARGRIAAVLGSRYAEIDAFPTRVRLPDEPLMLVDRIERIEGEPLSLGAGRVVTEHEVKPGAWYLDGGRIPTALAVEAGQADLFLCGFLGIDLLTRGRAVYRLLDAVVTFTGELPRPGEVIRYDVRIERFFRHGATWLFRFQFDATVGGRPLLAMRDGCAGFFTAEELAAGEGIVRRRARAGAQRTTRAGATPGTPSVAPFGSFAALRREAFAVEQLDALRAGGLARAFGPEWTPVELAVRRPLTVPGGKLQLVDRVLELDPGGGALGLGAIRAEAEIDPDSWFLACHFSDDQVMPGTLMYECCLQTLRIFLLRSGWVGESDHVSWQPVPGVQSRLKCRGQVLPTTHTVEYQVEIKELGQSGPEAEPYALADAHIVADGKQIVEITDLSVRLAGASRGELERLWARCHDQARVASRAAGPLGPGPKPALYDRDRILAFSSGRPSDAFGERYLVFDEQRKIARLPQPPYQFLDRITAVEGTLFELRRGASCEAQVEVDPAAWYWKSNRQREIPYAILLEMALQPCGWLAAYCGSALTSDVDLRFRNLGGEAVVHRSLLAAADLVTTRVELTDVAKSGDMIVQHYRFELSSQSGGRTFGGTTYFGFFTAAALAEQVGLRDSVPYAPSERERQAARAFPLPDTPPFPDETLRMVERLDLFAPDGGPHGLGLVAGSIDVDPAAWFFAAHFFEDPVWPGSLGLEGMLQLLKALAVERWGAESGAALELATFPENLAHRWVYRGQVVPSCRRVEVQAVVKSVDDRRRRIVADGTLSVDGRTIYRMEDFAVGVRAPRGAV